jgi:hypothetical protein
MVIQHSHSPFFEKPRSQVSKKGRSKFTLVVIPRRASTWRPSSTATFGLSSADRLKKFPGKSTLPEAGTFNLRGGPQAKSRRDHKDYGIANNSACA